MADGRNGRVVHRLDRALGQLVAAPALAAVDARHHPVQLGEDVVGEVERRVGSDVALDSPQDAERGQDLVRCGDLLALAADGVRVEARDDGHGHRVVADRQVRVAARDGGAAHLLHGAAAVRPRRVAVEVAADVHEVDERRGLAAKRLFSELRRAPGDAQCAVDLGLVLAVGQRLQRLDVRGGAGGADQPGTGLLRRRDEELDGDALDGDADRPPVFLLDERDDLRQRLEAPDRLGRILCGRDDRELLAAVAEAPRVAGGLGAQGLRRSRSSAPARGSAAARAPAAGTGLARAPPGASPRSSARFPAPPASRPCDAASRSSSSVRTPSAWPMSIERLALRPSSRPTPIRSGEIRSSSSLSSCRSPVSTSSRRRASIAGPIPRSSRILPVRTSSATGTAESRRTSAARRYARTLYELAPESSSSVAKASSLAAISEFCGSRGVLTWVVSPPWRASSFPSALPRPSGASSFRRPSAPTSRTRCSAGFSPRPPPSARRSS